MHTPHRTFTLGAAMLALIGALCFAAPAAAQDSVADQARTARKNKPAAAPHVYDNDNLPREDKLSIVGNAQPAPDTAALAEAAAANSKSSNEYSKLASPAGSTPAKNVSDDQKTDTAKPADQGANTSEKDAAAKKQAEWAQWKDKITGQKDAIDLAQRELDVTQGEYKLRAAAMYGDVGNRLRNQEQWDKEDAAFKQKLDTQKKALDDAKQKLEEMQEEARKAGVPASMREP